MKKYRVIETPWVNDLPNGTIIVFHHKDRAGRYWFEREDRLPVADGDGLFVLHSSEYEEIE